MPYLSYLSNDLPGMNRTKEQSEIKLPIIPNKSSPIPVILIGTNNISTGVSCNSYFRVHCRMSSIIDINTYYIIW